MNSDKNQYQVKNKRTSRDADESPPKLETTQSCERSPLLAEARTSIVDKI